MVFVGLLLVIIFEYLRPGGYVSALSLLNTALPLTVFVLSLFVKGNDSNIEIWKERNGRLLLFYIFLVGVSVLTAHVTHTAFDKFRTVFGFSLLFFIIAKHVSSISRFRIFFTLLVLVHATLLILHPDLVLHPETRTYLSGTTFLNDGNDFAWSVCIVTPMCLFLLQEERKLWKKYVYFALLAGLLLALVGTQSRGASLSLAAIFLYQWIRSRKKAKGLLWVSLVVVAVLAYAPSAYFDRMDSIRDYETESSAQHRIVIWGSAIRMANDHPFLGIGAGHFPVAFGTAYRPPGESATSMAWQNAHSIFFMLLGELGYPGLLFLLAFFLLNWAANQQRIREISQYEGELAETHRRLLVCIDSSLIGYAVAGAFLSGIYYPHLFVLAGLSTAGAFEHHRALAELRNQALRTQEQTTDITSNDMEQKQ